MLHQQPTHRVGKLGDVQDVARRLAEPALCLQEDACVTQRHIERWLASPLVQLQPLREIGEVRVVEQHLHAEFLRPILHHEVVLLIIRLRRVDARAFARAAINERHTVTVVGHPLQNLSQTHVGAKCDIRLGVNHHCHATTALDVIVVQSKLLDALQRVAITRERSVVGLRADVCLGQAELGGLSAVGGVCLEHLRHLPDTLSLEHQPHQKVPVAMCLDSCPWLGGGANVMQPNVREVADDGLLMDAPPPHESTAAHRTTC